MKHLKCFRRTPSPYFNKCMSKMEQLYAKNDTILLKCYLCLISSDISHDKIGVFIYFQHVSSKLLKRAFLLLTLANFKSWSISKIGQNLVTHWVLYDKIILIFKSNDHRCLVYIPHRYLEALILEFNLLESLGAHVPQWKPCVHDQTLDRKKISFHLVSR